MVQFQHHAHARQPDTFISPGFFRSLVSLQSVPKNGLTLDAVSTPADFDIGQ